MYLLDFLNYNFKWVKNVETCWKSTSNVNHPQNKQQIIGPKLNFHFEYNFNLIESTKSKTVVYLNA